MLGNVGRTGFYQAASISRRFLRAGNAEAQQQRSAFESSRHASAAPRLTTLTVLTCTG